MPPAPSRPPAQGFARILHVAEVIATHGPIKLEQIMDRTHLPRSAAYRSVKELEAQGWIRKPMSGAGFCLTAQMHHRFGSASGVTPNIERLAMILKPVVKKARIDADIAVLGGLAEVQIQETTRPPDTAPMHEPFLASPLTLACLLVTGTEARLAHVRAGMDAASPEEQRDVTSGRFTRQLAETAKTGFVWDTSSQSLCFPFVDNDGAAGAVRLEGSGANQRTARKLEALLREIKQTLPTIVPDTDQIQRRYWPALVNRPTRNNLKV